MKIISRNQIHFFRDNEIIRIESTPDAALTHLLNGTTLEISETIDNIEVQLAETGFIRMNKCNIVNLNHVASISKGADNFIMLDNGLKLPITANRKETLITLLNNHLNNNKP